MNATATCPPCPQAIVWFLGAGAGIAVAAVVGLLVGVYICQKYGKRSR